MRCQRCAGELFSTKHCELCTTVDALRALTEGVAASGFRYKRLGLQHKMQAARYILARYDERYPPINEGGNDAEKERALATQ